MRDETARTWVSAGNEPSERSRRESGIFENDDLDRLRWCALDNRIGLALARIAASDRLGVDRPLRDATTSAARIRVWCGELAASRLVDEQVRSILSRTYRWTAMLADDLAEVAEGSPRTGAFPLGAYAELAASCFVDEMAAFGDVPLLSALKRDLRALLRAVRS